MVGTLFSSVFFKSHRRNIEIFTCTMPAAVVSPQSPQQQSSTGLCISHISTTADSPQVAHLKSLHQKASRALILSQSATAWSHCCEAVQHCALEKLARECGEQQSRQLCCRLWILYICVISSLAEPADEDGKIRVKRSAKDTPVSKITTFPATVREAWDSIMVAFGGVAGNVDSEVLVPTVLLCLKLRDAKTARDIVEMWFATLSDDTLQLLQNDAKGKIDTAQQRGMVQASYLRVCELYVLHIMPQLNDFQSAQDFLGVSSLLSKQAQEELTRRLEKLRNPPSPKKKQLKPRKRKRKINMKNAQKPKQPVAIPASNSSTDTVLAISPTQTQTQAAATTAVPSARTKGTARSAITSSRASTGTKTRTLTARRRPQNLVSVTWRVVRRLISRWGFTLFTLAIVVAILRMISQRLRLGPLFNFITRKIWDTIKMGTKVTYI